MATANSESVLANWNGVEMPLSEVRVSVLDRSFMFGDAVYEVVRVYRGKPFLLQDHLDRLERNLNKLALPSDINRIAERLQSTLKNSGLQEATIYLHITRGEAPRTHAFPDPPPRPNELIYVQEFRDPYVRQRRDGGSAILIDDIRWKRCDLKSVNLLANCMGADQARRAGCDEAIFVDAKGTLVEGTHTSLFGVQGGSIITAPLDEGLLPGITRRMILELAASEQIPVIEQRIERSSLSKIDELFITGTSTEIMPIIKVDEISIGLGRPGPVVQRLQHAYTDLISAN